MDAHLFRRVCEALIPRLDGARLEKIQAPASDVVCLSFYARRQKLHLLVRYGRRDSFLCPVQERPAAPSKPSAQVMLLRKHLQGGRVRACVAHWPQRCLYILCSSASQNSVLPHWLCLDLRSGPRLEHRDCPDMCDAVCWPGPEELPRALEEWRAWPALTPALRRTLPLLEACERQALLVDLAAGGGDIFVYGREAELEILAWPLPNALRGGREERVFADPLEAASLAGATRAVGAQAAAGRTAQDRLERLEARRLQRLLDKLDAEERRLRELADMQREGLALQAHLWRYPPDFKTGELILDSAEGPVCIRPDPRYSLREHMERLFHNAGRGRRGLALLEPRRAELRARIAQAEASLRSAQEQTPFQADQAPYSGVLREAGTPSGLPANVQAFASSDGIVILRGRDAKGNRALLRLADPYDLWMHVEGGPGAHVLVRRAQGRDTPRRTLHEAANLALVKSWQRGSLKAGVMCAQARHVRPVKGGTPGSVRVDKVECLLELQIDPDIELRVARLYAAKAHVHKF